MDKRIEQYVRPCVGCGYCCAEAPCFLSYRVFNTRPGETCQALYWRESEKKYRCVLADYDPDYAKHLFVGEGCCSPLNTWRKDVRKRQTIEVQRMRGSYQVDENHEGKVHALRYRTDNNHYSSRAGL